VIGSLRGTVVDRSASGEVVIEVGGVGYRALVAGASLAQLDIGVEARVFTHLHVRDDALTLYGFATRDERDCFEALIGAHGVGPSLALAILSVHSPPALRQAVAEGDIDALTLVPGVGRKTAARLLIELRSRLEAGDVDDVAALAPTNGHDGSNGVAATRADLRAALAGLGYEPSEVAPVLRELPPDGQLEDLLRLALKLLAESR
jgi:Holliday junction DNA helicase RuvA